MINSSFLTKTRYVIIGILLLATSLRVHNLSFQPLWSDEIDVLKFVDQPNSILFDYFLRPSWNGPLYYFILHWWFKLVGLSTFTLRYFSVLVSVMAISIAWLLARLFLPKNGELGTCLLMATSPYLIWYGQDGKMYSLFLFISLLTLFLLFIACKNDRLEYWLIFLLLVWVSWSIHVLSVLSIPSYIIYWAIFSKKEFKLQHIGWLFTVGLILAPFLFWAIPTLFSDFTTGHKFVPLIEIIQIELFVFSIGYSSRISWIAGCALLFLFIYGVIKIIRTYQFASILILHFTIPILLIFLISFGMPIFTDRYLIPISFSFYSICALSLLNLQNVWFKLPRITIIIIVIINLTTVYFQANTAIKHPF